MKEALEQQISEAVKAEFSVDQKVELTRPEEQFGDYSTNVALQLSKQLGKNPREIAEALKPKLEAIEGIASVDIAGPGFLNLKLTDVELVKAAQVKPAQSLTGQVIVTEYSDPNPFKILHVGHIYTTVVGDAIANLLEQAGATVHRVNYGGDVGLHVGKSMWAIIQELGGENPDKLAEIPATERAAWLATAYVAGNDAYENDPVAKEQIVAYNKQVYAVHANDDHDSAFAQIYWTCREWSYAAFGVFYARLGTEFERYYPESRSAQIGLDIVRQHIGDVFTESDGAVIFKGEDYDLHTRVFINKEGLPTYEAKEIGTFVNKKNDYNFDKSVIILGNEQDQYMQVVVKALEQFMPEIARVAQHIPHGMVKLTGGVKMSSRLGNIIQANDVLDMVNQAISDAEREPNDMTMLGAIKYSFLKTKVGGDVIFEPKESVSLEGNSGPYLQYAHARARSILGKAPSDVIPSEAEESRATKTGSLHFSRDDNLEAGERSLLRKVSEYPEVVDKAVTELMPHHICTYLYELAQVFNRFYEKNRVIDDERQNLRLALVQSYANTLKSGLSLLGIAAPDKM